MSSTINTKPQIIMIDDIEDEAKILKIIPYKKMIIKKILFYFLCFISLGIFYLISRWYLKIKIMFTLKKCSPEAADFYLIYSIGFFIFIIITVK